MFERKPPEIELTLTWRRFNLGHCSKIYLKFKTLLLKNGKVCRLNFKTGFKKDPSSKPKYKPFKVNDFRLWNRMADKKSKRSAEIGSLGLICQADNLNDSIFGQDSIRLSIIPL